MNVDPQSNKYDQLFNLKGLIRPPLLPPPKKKKLTLVSPPEKSRSSAKF